MIFHPSKWYALSILFTLPCLGYATNLWENPGFESWNTQDNLPSNTKWRWKFPGKGIKSFECYERSSVEKHSGSYSLLLKDSDSSRENHTLAFVLAGNDLKRLKGKVLRFSAWIKQLQASTPNAVGISLLVQADGKWEKAATATGSTAANDWRQLQTKLLVPDNATLVLAVLQCANGWGNTGEAFFDDLLLTTDVPGELNTASAAIGQPPVPGQAKITNSGDTPEIAAYRQSYRDMAPVDSDGYSRPEIRNGTWYINGKPEYYLGVWLYNRTHVDWGANANPLNIDHIAYKERPGKKVFDAQGFNSSQISAAHVLPGVALHGLPLPRDWRTQEKRIAEFFQGFEETPLVLDFAFGYHSQLPVEQRKELDQRNGKWHEFFPLCPEHPEGDRYYQDYFKGGTRAALKNKSNVFLYELFNESSYNCQCRFNARDFADRMQKKYETIGKANRIWGTVFDNFNDLATQTNFGQYPRLWPDWCKFNADRYAEILTKYKELIRQIDRRDHVYFTEQAAGLPPAHPGMDYRKIASVLDALAIEGGWRYGYASDFQAQNEGEAVVASGGSQHWFNCDFYQALTKGKKPIVNDEHYCTRIENGVRVPSRREDMITSLWLEIMHGVSSNFTYVWDKRSWDWKTFEQAKNNVLKPSYKSSSLLNPYNWPPDQLDAFKRFQKELAPYKEKILPFPRTKPATVAVFFSYPTLRMSEYIQKNYMKEVSGYYTALLHEHFPVKVVFEQELKSLGPEVQALIFPGCQFATPETLKDAMEFQKRGGIVIAGKEAFQKDEYSAPLPQNTTFFRVDNVEAAIEKLRAHTIKRYASVEPADGENRFSRSDIQIIDRGEFKLIVLVNMDDMHSRLAHVSLFLDGQAGPFYLTDIINKRLLLNGAKETWSLPELQKGFELILPPQERVILTLEIKRPQDATAFSAADMHTALKQALSRELPVEQVFRKRSAEKRLRAIESRIYRDVNPVKCRPLDLRKFVNMGFKDEVAGDRKGGWFDQGANDFSRMPLGRQTFAGVPFEIIDPAQNDGKGVAVLWGKHRDFFPTEITQIPVGGKVKSLYFLHTMGWGGREALVYRIHYEDGTTLDIPVREGFEIAGWWGVTELPNAKIAVESSNTEKDKINMQCFRWNNPKPDKAILTVDLLSSRCEALPAIAAITAEEF